MAQQESSEAVRRTDVTVKTMREIQNEQRDAARRKVITLHVTLVTLAWLVTVPLLIGWELTGADSVGSPAQQAVELTVRETLARPQRGGAGYLVAAVLMVLLPFVAGVIATKGRRFFLGGTYVVLTLAMVLPAISIAGRG